MVRRLLDDGHEVSVLDDFSRGRPERLPMDVGPGNVHHADIRDVRALAHAAQGCKAIVHLAYLQGTQTFYAEPRQVLEVATLGMLNVLATCEKQGIGDLLLVSSSEAYQVAPEVPTPENVPLTVPDVLNPRYSYGGGKIVCELMALAWQRTGVLDRVQIARPHNIIGPDMGREHVVPEFAMRMNQILAEPGLRDATQPVDFPIQGSGEETRSFCFIGDCIEQLRLIQEHGNESGAEIYHVGTEDERSISEVAHAVAACYGQAIKVTPGVLPKGSPPRRCPDTSKVRALGFHSPTPFMEAIARTVAWYASA